MNEPPPTRRFSRLVDAIQYVVGVAAATAVVLLFSLGGDGSASDRAVTDAGADPTVAPPPQLELGRRIFAENCAICHGPTGAGGTGPALDAGLVDKYPDAKAQELVITFGRNAMIGFSDRLTPDQISAVVVYTREALGRENP